MAYEAKHRTRTEVFLVKARIRICHPGWKARHSPRAGSCTVAGAADPLFQIDIAEQRPTHLVRPAHLPHRRYLSEG